MAKNVKKKGTNRSSKQLKKLDELVEVLDNDKLRNAVGGLTLSPTRINIAFRPREDVGGILLKPIYTVRF